MKRLLKSLKFDVDTQPSRADQARITNEIADLLRRAHLIGYEHASDETRESHAWGGSFSDMWQSARDIVSNFVQRIEDWLSTQDVEDLTDEELQAEIDDLAATVGDVEIQSAIESAVLDELDSQGFMSVQWYAQPDACKLCQANAAQGPVPIGSAFESGDATPPAHPSCRCSIGSPSEGE